MNKKYKTRHCKYHHWFKYPYLYTDFEEDGNKTWIKKFLQKLFGPKNIIYF